MRKLFDAHNHLQDAWLTPHRQRVFADLTSVGIRSAVVNGTSEADWHDVLAVCAEASPSQLSSLNSQLHLLPSFGLHPWDVGNRTPDWQKNLRSHLDANPKAAVGEIGLDRWILDRARPDDPRLAGLRRASVEEQMDAFRWQLILAAERNLPASIHCLDAFGLLHDALRSTPRPSRGFLLHAYSGPAEMVTNFARLGAYFSFNGSFLDPRKARLRAVYEQIPLDRLLVETDAPAMNIPEDRRPFTLPPTADGETINHPANLTSTYAGLAALRHIDEEDLAIQVERNFNALFQLP